MNPASRSYRRNLTKYGTSRHKRCNLSNTSLLPSKDYLSEKSRSDFASQNDQVVGILNAPCYHSYRQLPNLYPSSVCRMVAESEFVREY